MKTMKWIKNDNFIVDMATGEIQCMLAKNEDAVRDKMIELSPELFLAVVNFVDNIDSGKFTARSAYNEFQQILNRVPQEMIDDAKEKVEA